jgi:sugar transferase (PEP-CTERM/EpsH1 system associated)
MSLTGGELHSTRPIRIVHLVSTLNMGGLEMFVWNLARLTDSTQFTLHVVCLGEPGALAGRFSELSIPVIGLNAGDCSKARTVFRLLRYLRRLNPDILHTHNPSPHLFGTIATRLMRSPLLINTKHGRNRTDLPRQITMNRILSNLSTCVVPVSADAASVARDIERVPESKLKVIRNGIDLESFRPAPVPRSFCKRGIHVARLNLIKDQVTLLKAARHVLDAEPEFQLDIVGDGPSRAELEALHRDLGLKESVRFLGFRDEIRELLIDADMFVLSSLSEGISLTLLEAMAMELPVVATDVGGNREVVASEKTGLLVPAQSPRELADAIITLLKNPDLARAMGRAGRQRVEAEFDLHRAVKEYESLYKFLIYSRSRSGRTRGFSELAK